ncbi:MAG TPA: DUF4291 domain-containing protein [Allosphingosinicella sp.]|jgi:hypothetical protein
MTQSLPDRQIRAVYDDRTIRVYQAYSDQIAGAALAHGRFVSPPFSLSRMTWIKPSFLWMMYRAGWGFKDEGQRRILAIDIARSGFDWALANACLSHAPPGMGREEWGRLKASKPVRIQWDPERDLHLRPLAHRAVQIGLGPDAARFYVDEWIVRIAEVTDLAHRVHALVEGGRLDEAAALLPREKPYPGALPRDLV